MNSLSFPDINVWLADSGTRTRSCRHCKALVGTGNRDHRVLSSDAAWLPTSYDDGGGHGRQAADHHRSMARLRPLVRRRPRDVRLGTPRGGESGFVRRHRDEPHHPKFGPMHGCSRVAQAAEGVLVTFDKALASRGAYCLLSRRGESIGG
jgi:hypothetical protein